MKALLYIGLVLALAGFGGLLSIGHIPGTTLTLPVVIACMASACLGCGLMILYGVETYSNTSDDDDVEDEER